MGGEASRPPRGLQQTVESEVVVLRLSRQEAQNILDLNAAALTLGKPPAAPVSQGDKL